MPDSSVKSDAHRILVVDDNYRIHDDFRKIFRMDQGKSEFDQLKQQLFGPEKQTFRGEAFQLICVDSGESSVREVCESMERGDPFSMAFIDIRMPGWDGIQTARELWKCDPDIQIVICSAFSDYSWESMVEELGPERPFLILKKPFDVVEVKQMAHMLTAKWDALRAQREHLSNLNKALKAKDDFLARVSHEVRTPLHGIIGIVELLRETKLDEQQVDFVQTLASCGESLDRIIDDILDYSAIEDGRFALSPEPVNLPDLLANVLKQFQFESLSRGVALEFEALSDLPEWIEVDVTRLNQVFGNLLRNAFKFSEVGVIVLRVKLEEVFEDSYSLSFEVEDMGIGISESFLARVFSPFSQAEHVNQRRFGGTGLGLSICKGLVESMHGTIGIKSEVGKGTLVRFTVQVGKSGGKVDVEKAGKDRSSAGYMRSRVRVLAVDDSVTNRKVIQNQLYWLGYECETASGCAEAIQMIATRKFGLILMDCQMPEIDGFETTRKIREIYPEYEEVPVVALTANIDKQTQERCLSAGMCGFISKPARKQDIELAIQEVISI